MSKVSRRMEREAMAQLKTCFFISAIGEPGSQERRCSDAVLKHIVEPAVNGLGYDTPKRADHITKPGTISAQVFEQLLHADLVIADLSGRNPNVFYELAVRHMLKKPFVQLIDKTQSLPFDIAHERTVLYTLHVDDVEQAKQALRSMVEAGGSDPKGCETLLSRTIEFSIGQGDVDVQKGVLTEILSRLQEIQEALDPALNRRVIPQSARFYGGSESIGGYGPPNTLSEALNAEYRRHSKDRKRE
ncbi:MAG: hypothetical protein U0Q18_22195 [Bryobacteraceae bacterium]